MADENTLKQPEASGDKDELHAITEHKQSHDERTTAFCGSADTSNEPNTNMNASLKLKVESARERLESSNSSTRLQKPPNTANGSHHVSFARSKSRTSYQLPIVYFVVKKDKMPRLAENFDNDQTTSMCAYATKSRSQFLTKMRERKRLKEEREQKVKDEEADIGLMVGPVKTNFLPTRSRCWLSKQPTTPFNTMSERSELRSSDTVFCNNDGLHFEDKLRGSTSGSDGYNMSLGCPEKPRLTPFDIELPGLKSETRSDTSGSAGSRRVRFSKSNPRSKSCSIQLPKVDQSADDFQEKQFKGNCTKVQEREIMVDNTSPLSSGTASPGKQKRPVNPLNLPKIDIMTPIYDELILKTFQAFTTKKNPLADRNTRAILQRVSAFLHPLDDIPRSQDGQGHSRPQIRENSFFSTEPPEEFLDDDFKELSSSSFTIDGKSMSVLTRDMDSRQRRTHTSSCFTMAPPGLGKEETELFQSRRKPDIYIPSSC